MRPSVPEPIGIGYGEVEALSGYVQRLAAFHGTLPSQLLHRYLGHLVAAEPEYVGRWRAYPGVLRYRGTINGFAHADQWLRCLWRVFGMDLQALTSRCWETAFAGRQLFSHTMAWCPDCLKEDRTPYYRLLWCLKEGRVCVRHNRVLSSVCPTCQRSIPQIHQRSLVGRCPWCSGSLIADDPRSPSFSLATETSVMEELAGLVQKTFWPNGAVALCGTRLQMYSKNAGIADPTALAKKLCIHKSTTWYWWSGKFKPEISHSLAICRILGLRLVHAVSPELDAACLPIASPVQLEFQLTSRNPRRELDWAVIRRRLKTESAVPLERARSLASVGRELRVAVRTLRAHEPELCGVIGRRFVLSRRNHSLEKARKLREEILNACDGLQKIGDRVTFASVAAYLKHPGLFSRPVARRAFADVLGLDYTDWPETVTVPGRQR